MRFMSYIPIAAQPVATYKYACHREITADGI